MGFTRWPSDLTEAGVRRASDFAHAHGDLVSVMVIGGLPWPEALAGAPFSADVTQTLSYRPPGGQAVFLSISPLDMTRRALAPYWGERDNQPLPAPWAGRAFDHPDVVKAFVAFCLRAVDLARPAVLAVGVEDNILLTTDPKAWPALKRLHRAPRGQEGALDAAGLLHDGGEPLPGHTKEAKRSLQEAEVADLMRDSDLFALSVYPFMSLDTPRPTPDDFLDFAPRLGKPVAISESGMTSRDVRLDTIKLRGSDEQRRWVDLLLRTAARDRYRSSQLRRPTPRARGALAQPTADLARIWSYTGMQTERAKKPALAAWDRWFAATLVAPR
jgi:hypothetical protein